MEHALDALVTEKELSDGFVRGRKRVHRAYMGQEKRSHSYAEHDANVELFRKKKRRCQDVEAHQRQQERLRLVQEQRQQERLREREEAERREQLRQEACRWQDRQRRLAEELRQQELQRQREEAERREQLRQAARRRQEEQQRHTEERRRQEFLRQWEEAERLERLHREEAYRQQRRELEENAALQQAFQRYERMWDQFRVSKGIESKTITLKFEDLPWPVVKVCGLVSPMDITRDSVREFVLHPLRTIAMATQTRRKCISKEMLRWHPDKFLKVIGKIEAGQRESVLEAANAISQFLSEMLSEAPEHGL